ncbi:MAG: hypothetical protein HYY76_07565 [Acidobacteria bacterium]|nr:hypothetical protein [Acidobacteriota bacterium]
MPARAVLAGSLCILLIAALAAQPEPLPTARLVRASRLVMPGRVDSNVPMAWELVDGRWQLVALVSFGGIPARLSGSALEEMQEAGPVAIEPHPGHGIWIESVIPDENGTWYGYYHHESPADECGRADRFIPRIGAMRSTDRGATWKHLGVILEAPPDSAACRSTNRYVLGGVGDLSAMLNQSGTDVFLFFSQYGKSPSQQGVAVARLAWADRDAPVGRLTIWENGAWMPARAVAGSAEGGEPAWTYPAGTPLVAPTRPWHDGNGAADVFWGPSVHWNHYLERYVMLVNRAANEHFNSEGIYVSYATALEDPRGWSRPRKIMDGGAWYPQVAGLEPTTGPDKAAGPRARFLLTGRSDYYIEFQR